MANDTVFFTVDGQRLGRDSPGTDTGCRVPDVPHLRPGAPTARDGAGDPRAPTCRSPRCSTWRPRRSGSASRSSSRGQSMASSPPTTRPTSSIRADGSCRGPRSSGGGSNSRRSTSSFGSTTSGTTATTPRSCTSTRQARRRWPARSPTCARTTPGRAASTRFRSSSVASRSSPATMPSNDGSVLPDWGDSRPGNIIYRDFAPTAAVLDWEVATHGSA